MTKVFIIHGSQGSPKGNWFPWLKEQLESLECKVFSPQFPAQNQNLNDWLKEFSKIEQELDKNSIMVGHSLGPAFIMNVLQKRNSLIKSAFFVAGFTQLLGNATYDPLNKSFVEKGFDWKKIKQNCKKFYLFQSSNDPYVPLKEAQLLAKNLGEKLIIVEKAGHFMKSDGFARFELLLDEIKKEL
ncbi:MAG: alpha/beta hydrolase [archaeon]|nr:alpha/beta hydrolase [archaeon]